MAVRLTLLAVLLAVALPAHAATPAGSTWYTNGTQNVAGAGGAVVRVYAVGAFKNLRYTLVLGTNNEPGHQSEACFQTVAVLNANGRYANSSGFIPVTVGIVPANTPPGTYQVCFKEDTNSTTATAGAFFTVL